MRYRILEETDRKEKKKWVVKQNEVAKHRMYIAKGY
jgi:hypothetical protein